MKAIHFLCASLLIPTLLWGQPEEYPEPCEGYQGDTLDIDGDGNTDLLIYVSSWGSEDVPSSYGYCEFKLAILNGGIIDLGQDGIFVARDITFYRSTVDFKTLDEYPSNVIHSIPYGTAIDEDTPEQDSTYDRVVPYWMLDVNGDTLIGWVQITIESENVLVQFSDASLSNGNQVLVGSHGPTESDIHMGWSSGINGGLYTSASGLDEVLFGGHLNYYLRYGINFDWWQVAYAQTELGFDALPINSGTTIGPVWTNRIHFIIFDFGVSTGYYSYRTGDQAGLLTRWEAGLSINNTQVLIYGALGGSSHAQMDWPGILINYHVPLFRH